MASKSKAAPGATPFGIDKKYLLAYYVLITTLSGNLIASSEPLKILLRQRGVFSQLPRMEQELWLADVTSVGVNFSILLAFFCGILNDYAGPRITAMLGQLTSAAGFLLMFFSPTDSKIYYYAALSSLGATYACVSISHTVIAGLFPGNATMAITIICVGNDISMGVPRVMEFLSKWTGLQNIVLAYAGLNLVLFVSEFFLVPSNGFTPPAPPSAGSEDRITAKASADGASDKYDSLNEPSEIENMPDNDDMASWGLMRQMATPHYLIITVFVAFNFFKRNHYMQFVLPTNLEIAKQSGNTPASAEFIVQKFSDLLSLCMFASFANGAFTNHFGVLAGMFALNTWSVLLFFVASIPVLWIQWFAILFFDMFAGFIFGLMYAYLGSFFGFSTLGGLQGMIKIFSGGFGFSFLIYQPLAYKLPNILWANRLMFGLSLLAYGLPLWLFYLLKQQKPLKRSDTSMSSVSTIVVMNNRLAGSVLLGGELDKSSLKALLRESKLRSDPSAPYNLVV